MAKRIEEFIQALDEEIACVRNVKLATVSLSNGKLTRQMTGHFVYEFCVDRVINAEDGTTAELEIAGKTYDCVVVAATETNIEIALSSHVGETLHNAKLVTKRHQVLTRLVERFQSSALNQPDIFRLAEKVFDGKSRTTLSANVPPRYGFKSDNPPNDSQAKAIENSFRNSLAVIWGPPGTGKTRTIARAVEAHLLFGRRVLLVSHANAAVDAALEDIAEQVRGSFYEAGKIIRLGVPKDQNLVERFPLVMMENISLKINADLSRQLEEVRRELNAVESALGKIEPLIRLFERIKLLEKQIQRPDTEILNKVDLLVAEIETAKSKLAHAQDAAKRVNEAVFAYTYAPKIKELKILIASRERIAFEASRNLFVAASNRSRSAEDKLPGLYAEFDEFITAKGLDPTFVSNENVKLINRQTYLNKKLREINDQVETKSASVLSEARVVATTLSKIYTSSALNDENFDVIIVDEASMVPMPLLYFALSKVKSAVTLVGDFKQLPPIVQSNSNIAQKWLGRSIFDQLKIADVESAQQNTIVSMLDTQYRMAPQIADISSKLFYGGRLKSARSTNSLGINDSVFGQSRLVIIDTSEVDPWCSSPPSGSRINLYSASLCVNICKRLLHEHADVSIGIAAPYRPQANLINEGVNDLKLNDVTLVNRNVLVNTVHRFQGGEAQAMIFDCVDGKGAKRSILNDGSPDYAATSKAGKSSNAKVMLNVALTRARSLFVLVVNRQHYLSTQPDSFFCKFIEEVGQTALWVNSREVDESFSVESLSVASTCLTVTSAHNEKNFWSVFLSDLKAANRSVELISPYITTRRKEFFLAEFEAMINRGVSLKIFTKPVQEHSQEHMKEGAMNMISALTEIGAQIYQVPKIHQKVVTIDDAICWEGSLNVLSHKDTLEQMRRSEGSQMVAEVKRNLRL